MIKVRTEQKAAAFPGSSSIWVWSNITEKPFEVNRKDSCFSLVTVILASLLLRITLHTYLCCDLLSFYHMGTLFNNKNNNIN